MIFLFLMILYWHALCFQSNDNIFLWEIVPPRSTVLRNVSLFLSFS